MGPEPEEGAGVETLKNGSYSSITFPWQGRRIHKVACLLCCHSSWGTIHSGALAHWTLLSKEILSLAFWMFKLLYSSGVVSAWNRTLLFTFWVLSGWFVLLDHWQAPLRSALRAGTALRSSVQMMYWSSGKGSEAVLFYTSCRAGHQVSWPGAL